MSLHADLKFARASVKFACHSLFVSYSAGDVANPSSMFTHQEMEGEVDVYIELLANNELAGV